MNDGESSGIQGYSKIGGFLIIERVINRTMHSLQRINLSFVNAISLKLKSG